MKKAMIIVPVAAFGASFGASPPVFAQNAEQTPITVNELKIGKPVYGVDGIRVGEINRIKADGDGRVTEIQVTTGGPAGLNAEVVAIKPSQIATAGPENKKLELSMSGAAARKLPVLNDSDKG
ncbi:MAG: PRC-barrel domain-containing protein [Hyphomicrobium sp.]